MYYIKREIHARHDIYRTHRISIPLEISTGFQNISKQKRLLEISSLHIWK